MTEAASNSINQIPVLTVFQDVSFFSKRLCPDYLAILRKLYALQRYDTIETKSESKQSNH